ncbi:hypothetical protein [Granulicella arctica]|uniref:Putative membrane protein n=1 Tax=Granulicella arctica TaxID=940613 RepID=A0A7Y9THK3_9BACT|nr:hypothetical protein [Granulicella arctica]NYF81176.1 putative membrane protein [Granulicella arctica]
MTSASEPSSERHTHGRLTLLLFPLVALIAVLPLILNGCSCGHDFDFHILSWMEAATQFSHGNLHPHWAFTPAFNAGEPRFVFYPPLSWSIGAVLGLLLPWTGTPIVYTWLVLTAAGLACHRLLRDFVPPSTALLVAALYAVNPYMLFTAYERTAYAELLAAAWLPLILHAILRKRVTIPRIAIPIALLWLTNAPAAVIGCYSLAILALVRLILTLRKPIDSATPPTRLALNTVAGTTLGLGLAAFYVLPAAYERRFVQIKMAMVEGMRITDNFLFHHTPDPDHDAVLRTASLLAISLLIATAASLFAAFLQSRKSNSTRNLLYALISLTAVITLLLTPLSATIWSHAPELSFLQFPWRFLAILTPALALSLAITLRNLRLTQTQAALISLILVSALIFAGYRQFRQDCDPEDTVAARLSLFHSSAGTDPTDEYTPTDADNDVLGKSNPPSWLAPDPDAPPPPNAISGPLHWPLDLTSPTQQVIILNLRNYPAWRITLNHQFVTTRLQRDDGLTAFPIPAGSSHLDIAYTRTTDQTTGVAISVASVAILLFNLRRRRHPR